MAADLGDYITLNGSTLLVQGLQAGKPASEFTSGLRVGRASYDDRQGAFYAVLDDFSGGFGHKNLDIREALGTHWDNPGGVDLRRARHVTLSPKRYIVSASAEPTAMILSNEILDGAALSVPADTSATNTFTYFGAGDRIYRIDSTRQQLVSVKDMSGDPTPPQKCTRFLLHRGGDGTRRLYLITTNPTINSPYYFSANPGAASPTFTQGSRNLWDAIEFEDVVIAQDTVFQIIFNKTPTAAADWNIDDVNDGEPIWVANSIVRFIGVSSAPWDNIPVVYFIDYGDGKLYALDFYIRRATPIEIGDFHYLLNGCVWNGQVAVTNGWNIWLYSPGGGSEVVRDISLFGRDGVPDTVKQGLYRITGLIDGGPFLLAIAENQRSGKAVTTTMGFEIFVYNGAGWSLYYQPVEASGGSTTLATNPIAAMIDRHPIGVLAAANVSTETSRALDILCQAHPTTTKLVKLQTFPWPKIGDIPIKDEDEFEGGNLEFYTGWFDGGFRDIEGALFYVKVDAADAGTTHAIEIFYRLNDDETAAFTSLGVIQARGNTTLQFDATNKAGVQFRTVQFKIRLYRVPQTALNGGINASVLSLTVDSATEIPTGPGILKIDNEYMKYTSKSGNVITLPTGARGVRGSTAASHLDDASVEAINLTPELRALTVCWHKKSSLRKSWVYRIDVNKMVEQATLVDTNVDGTPDTAATAQNVLDFIEALWDKKPLVKLVVPNQIPDADNMRVQVADFTIGLDDNRLTKTTRTYIDVTLIEPVQA